VRYTDGDTTIRCDRVFFDRSWRFVGRSSLVDGVKYRKKDGNMRPKPWAMFESGEAFWTTETEFEAAEKRAEVYRANEIIKEYLDDLSESDQRLLYDRLRQQFEEKSSARQSAPAQTSFRRNAISCCKMPARSASGKRLSDSFSTQRSPW